MCWKLYRRGNEAARKLVPIAARSAWNGAWSDDSALWDEHPAVQLELWPERGRGADKGGGGDDGVFWMDFESFCEIFTDIECCDRSTGLHDLALSVDGDDNSACGLCLSCVGGCAGSLAAA